MTRQCVVQRLADRARKNAKRAKISKQYATRLRAEGRAQAYRRAIAIIARAQP